MNPSCLSLSGIPLSVTTTVFVFMFSLFLQQKLV
jgi:hypothetical protein